MKTISQWYTLYPHFGFDVIHTKEKKNYVNCMPIYVIFICLRKVSQAKNKLILASHLFFCIPLIKFRKKRYIIWK